METLSTAANNEKIVLKRDSARPFQTCLKRLCNIPVFRNLTLRAMVALSIASPVISGCLELPETQIGKTPNQSQSLMTKPYSEPTLVPIGGSEGVDAAGNKIPPIILEIAKKQENKQPLTDAERKAVAEFNKSHPSTGLSAPEIAPASFEKTWDLDNNLDQQINKIQEIRSQWADSNVVEFPTPALGEVFDKVKSYHTRLQAIKRSNGNYTPEEIAEINNIYLNLITAPVKNRTNKQPEIYIDPKAQNGQIVAEQVKKVLSLFPDASFIKGIKIESRDITWKEKGVFGAEALTYFYPDGAEIEIADHPFHKADEPAEIWTDKKLLPKAIHEIIHAGSLFQYGYLSPADIVSLILEDIQLEDKKHKIGYGNTYLEEVNAYSAADLFANTNTLNSLFVTDSRYPEIRQAEINFINHLFAKLSNDPNFDIIKAGEKLGVR